MNPSEKIVASLSEVNETVDTTSKKVGWKRIFSFMGPAYLVSVGYMDPGNWATDIAGGSKYGYQLIWVLVISNLMAILLQSLSARLGIVRRRDLAQANREAYPRNINIILWLMAEIAIAATDLAEILGMAIGLQLLFGFPLIIGVSISVLDTFLLLYLQKLGIRKIEAIIIVLISIIGISFLINIILAQPSIHEIIKGLIPDLRDKQINFSGEGLAATTHLPKETALYLAIGMIGATIMPHNLYLHSALIQTRKINRSPSGIKKAIKWSIIDSSIALNVALLINAAILILAATVFFKTGRTNVGEIKQAHMLLSPLLGTSIASVLFAIALIASGQSSTVTGTLSGQIVMEGYLQLRINPVLRRLITRMIAVIPAILFIVFWGENNIDKLLIFSQVVLSVQLGFAVIPLIHFVSDKKTMNEFAIKKITQIAAWGAALLLIALNSKMIIDATRHYWVTSDNNWIKLLILIALLFTTLLLLFITIYPKLKKHNTTASINIHTGHDAIMHIAPLSYKKIGIALDFTENDHKIISAAIRQGEPNCEYILIHVIESAAALIHKENSSDYESEKDKEKMDKIISQLADNGIKAKGILGYRHTVSEIVRIMNEEKATLLVIGSHGHKGLKDFIYGSTINKVRHQLKIPIFIVNY